MRRHRRHILNLMWPAFSNFTGFGIIAPRAHLPLALVRTARNAPQNNYVITYRGNYVAAVNVTGR